MTTILVVDDDSQSRYMLEVLLKGHGYQTISAGNGAEALALASERPPSLIVTDILMPVMDGFTLCRRWRATEDLKGIPFVFYTATYTDARDEQFALSLGADRFVIKPAQPEVLARIIDDVLTTARERKPGGIEGEEEPAFLREHNDALFRKLEHKVAMLEAEIAERRRMEERLRRSQRMEAIGLLASGVAHDFNNLLGVILAHGELLSRTLAPDDPGQQRIETIVGAAERAAGLARQLLVFSNRRAAEPTTLDLGVAVRSVESMLRRVIGENVELIARCAPDLWPVLADQGQIEQVIMNLAINSRDAMPGGGRILIETRNADLSETASASGEGPDLTGPVVALSVSDTGVGMTAATRARLFEPFFSTKAPGKGTGLGLSIVRQIVDQSGGRIRVSSEPGRGATFTVYLPPQQETSAGQTSPRRKDDERRPTGDETILLVEDEAGLCIVMTEVLEGAGYRVVSGTSPAEALERLESFDDAIHLLLADVVMPEMNGPQLAAQVRRRLPDLRVLFMSGYADDHVARTTAGRTTRWIEKPFTQDRLLREVRDILDRPSPTSPGGTTR